MKKILLLIGLGFFSLGFSQYQNANNGWGHNSGSYYGNDDPYFDDDYYYNYPSDFYQDSYYTSFYNDYRRSIYDVNWERAFRELRLSPYQINLIIDLNNQFPNFGIWESYYRSNPNRWYYDRFYALQQILGPQVFIVFQDRYYRGYNPIVYYRTYVTKHYRPVYYMNPRYRNVNVNIYRVNKYDYHRSNNHQYGWNPNYNRHDPQGFKDDNNRRGDYNERKRVFRTEPQNSRENVVSPRNDNNGFRNTERQRVESRTAPSISKPVVERAAPRSSGFRSSESRSSQKQEVRTNTRSSRSGGFRSR